MNTPFLLLLTFIVASLSAQTQSWQLKKDQDGIKVYTADVEDSGFDAFKAVMTVKATPAQIAALLRDTENYGRIFPDTEDARVLKTIGDSSQIQYSRTDAPWPVSDRDGIYQMTFRTDPKTGAISTHAHAVPDYLPENEDVVRIKRTRSYWRITPKGKGMVEVEYEVYADPGGNIPEWLANSAVVDVPFGTFENLKELLAESD